MDYLLLGSTALTLAILIFGLGIAIGKYYAGERLQAYMRKVGQCPLCLEPTNRVSFTADAKDLMNTRSSALMWDVINDKI